MILGLLILCGWTSAPVHAARIDRVDYHGWNGCYRMSNGIVDLIYVPQIGRIMRYGFIGAQNILWENSHLAGKTVKPGATPDWANYGGDKLWPAPQSLWNWPPDPILDGSPYKVSVRASSLLISGENSHKSGVEFVREIVLEDKGTSVHITNWMRNTFSTPQDLAVWDIAQIDNPDYVTVPLEKTMEMPLGWAPYDDKPVDLKFVTVKGGELRLRRNPRLGSKLGSASSKGILTAEIGRFQFRMAARKLAGTYPDGGKFLEAFASSDPDKYFELEITGPITHMKPGQTVEQNVNWSLGIAGDAKG